MDANESLARRCAYVGIAGIALGIVSGVLGLMDPAGAYAPFPAGYNYAAQTGKTIAIINGFMMLCFTAAYLGYHFTGAVGSGMLGRTATGLAAVGNAAVALGFFHGALTGQNSPLIMAGYLVVPAFILLTVAALREKRVSAVQAWWPVGSMVLLLGSEMMIPMSGWSFMLHQIIFGSIAFVVLAILARAPAAATVQPA